MPSPLPSNAENWNALYSIAEAQAGHFTIHQAAAAGISKAMLQYYLKNGRLLRVMRGIYRLVQFPHMQHDEFVPLWLWSEQMGVYSHESALAFHELSDVLPANAHLKLPESWGKRRLRVPPDTLLHFGEVAQKKWHGPVPVTDVYSTLIDCILGQISAELIEDAFFQAKERGLLTVVQNKQIDTLLVDS